MRNCSIIPWQQGRTSIQGASPVSCALRGGQPGQRMSGLFCVIAFRTRGCPPCAAYAAIPAALPSSAKTGVIYGQALGKPVESRNLRFELLHLPLPDVMLEALKRLKSVCPILLHNIELKKFLRCYYDF